MYDYFKEQSVDDQMIWLNENLKNSIISFVEKKEVEIKDDFFDHQLEK